MRRLLPVPSLLALLVSLSVADTDFSQYVNVFAGTTDGGNMFPGVTAGPFAPVKLGPDFVYATAEAYSGYLPDINAKVTGFSLLHESGTGGAPKYGVVSQMPVPGSIPNPLIDFSVKRSKPDQGTVGYYNSSLANGVLVELAATNHVGFYQYTFPSGQQSNVVVDVSHLLPSFRGMNWGQQYQGGAFTIAPDGHYEGSGTYNKGWNLAPNWNIFFCGRFDQPAVKAQTFDGVNQTLKAFGKTSAVSGTDRLGGVFTFTESVVSSRVAVSWTSTQQACTYLDNEIPAGSKVDDLVNASKIKWNTEVFAKIQTTDTNNTILAQLYTSLYGMHLLPSNRTGDNPAFQSTEPAYDDIFTFWDLFRCTTPLFHILQPSFYEELLRSIIDVWRHEGWMPDGRSSNFNGRTQGGSNADNILADAYVKGVRGAINWADGYSAMVKNAETAPPNNHDPSAPDSSTAQGRGALPDWLQYGYITPTFSRAVTRAVEYSGNDFALHQIANATGNAADSLKYIRRSRNWRNHWDPNAKSFNTTGFLVPRLANGSLVKQDPMSCDGCYWKAPYYEGLPWEYTVGAHHDIDYMIGLGGGADNFITRLNTLMDPARKIFNPGNEPSFTTPYLYNFAGRQDLSVQQSRRVAKTQYNPGPGGLPGASDAGAMQSWILWNMIGLYPITGQTTFLIGSPWFQNMTMQVGNGKTLQITTINGDSDVQYYVQSLKVNGQVWNKNWVTWEDIFANGGTMDFVLGPNPVHWDTGPLPPSPASQKSVAADNGGPYKIAAPSGPAVDMPKPVSPKTQKREQRIRIEKICVGVLGGITIVAALALCWWMWRVGFIGRKKLAPIDVEQSIGVDGDKETKGDANEPPMKKTNSMVIETKQDTANHTDDEDTKSENGKSPSKGRDSLVIKTKEVTPSETSDSGSEVTKSPRSETAETPQPPQRAAQKWWRRRKAGP